MAPCLICNFTPEESFENVGLSSLPEDSCKQLCTLFSLDETKYLEDLKHQKYCDTCSRTINLAQIYEEQILHIQRSIVEVRQKLETFLKSSFFHSLQSNKDEEQQGLRESLLTDLHVILKVQSAKEEPSNVQVSEVVVLDDYGVEEIVATAVDPLQVVSPKEEQTAGTVNDADFVTEFTFGAIDNGEMLNTQTKLEATDEDPGIANSVQDIDFDFLVAADDGAPPEPDQPRDTSADKDVTNSKPLVEPDATLKVEVRMLTQEEVEKWTSKNPDERMKVEKEYEKEERIRKRTIKMKTEPTAKKVSKCSLDCPFSNCKNSFPTNMGVKEHVRRVHTRPEYITADKKAVEGSGIEIEIGHFFSDIQEGENKYIICSYENCFARYRKMVGLRQHIRLAHEEQSGPGQPFRCQQKNCFAAFNTYRGLEIHIRRSHLNVPGFLCKCGKAYKTRAEYRSHNKETHNNIECTTCLQEFASRNELRKHRGNAHPRDFMRRMKDPTRAALQREEDQNLRKTCERRVPGGPDAKDTIMYVCPHCTKTSDTWYKILDHMAIHGEKKYTCDQCDAGFYYPSKLKRHMLVHTQERNHMCHSCGKAFLTSTELTYHQKNHCPGLRTDVTTKPYECSLCFKRYQDRCSLGRHMKEHAGFKVGNNRPQQKCDKCDYRTSNPTLLKYHKMTHDGTFSSPCNQCDKKFRFPRHLKWHIRLVHENIGRYECDKCNYKTNHKQAYVDHMNVHTNESPHICEQCGKSYRRLNHLRRHQSDKHGRTATDIARSTAIKRAFDRKRMKKEEETGIDMK